jgi:beta-glucosidase
MSDPTRFTRRSVLVAGAALATSPVLAIGRTRLAPNSAFPSGFLWGAATAGHQVEGNNTASDLWLLEYLKPTAFAEPSGDACNSLMLWPRDLDLVRQLGLNSYRFSIEWARIEPEPGVFSTAMLDHYEAMIGGCRERGLTPLVTFNHFTAPRWFAAQGGWLSPGAPDRFARFCERAARHLARDIGYAMTLNEPNLLLLLRSLGLPPAMWEASRASLAAAARASGTERFSAANVVALDDVDAMQPILIAGHRKGRAAIKSVRPDLPVGVTLAVADDEAVGNDSLRDAKRAELYGAWLAAAKGDDFIGVQNYERARWDAQGRLPPPPDAKRNDMGGEVYAPSLAGAVRYVHAATGLPIVVTEHGVGTDDDALRAQLIPAALAALKSAMDDGVPVKGYVHWSLLDNFEWVFGYRRRFGLVTVNRSTFARTPKPSAGVLGGIARRNAL